IIVSLWIWTRIARIGTNFCALLGLNADYTDYTDYMDYVDYADYRFALDLDTNCTKLHELARIFALCFGLGL
ncbi:hypothetical protein, partial [Flavobacterium soli]|uniref:hypothetical protein n=1 Tax=Flavobacterium soli TaxID=344881 RepID=UPI0005588774